MKTHGGIYNLFDIYACDKTQGSLSAPCMQYHAWCWQKEHHRHMMSSWACLCEFQKKLPKQDKLCHVLLHLRSFLTQRRQNSCWLVVVVRLCFAKGILTSTVQNKVLVTGFVVRSDGLQKWSSPVHMIMITHARRSVLPRWNLWQFLIRRVAEPRKSVCPVQNEIVGTCTVGLLHAGIIQNGYGYRLSFFTVTCCLIFIMIRMPWPQASRLQVW
jgi:hypothetical protein